MMSFILIFIGFNPVFFCFLFAFCRNNGLKVRRIQLLCFCKRLLANSVHTESNQRVVDILPMVVDQPVCIITEILNQKLTLNTTARGDDKYADSCQKVGNSPHRMQLANSAML